MPKYTIGGGWTIIATVDSDDQLTLSATHNSNTNVFDTEEDLGDDKEFMVRLSCDAVEEQYLKENAQIS